MYRAGSFAPAMPKLMMITHNPFWRADGGSRRRICALTRALDEAGWETHVCFDGVLDQEPAEDICRSASIQSIGASGTNSAPRGARTARGWRLEAYHSESMPGLVAKMGSELGPDAVMTQLIRHAYLLRYLPDTPAAQRICDTHDLMYERCDRFQASGCQHWLDISRDEEAAVLGGFDLIIAMQDRDARRFREMAPGVPVVTVPHTPGSFCKPLAPRPDDDRPVVGFIGCVSPPNRDAVRFLVEQIWPALAEQVSDLELVVAGECSKWVAGASAEADLRVRVVGCVAEPSDFYSQIDILINPVRFGAGLKVKNVEALWHGRALVTSPIGAEGMEDGAGDAFLVCEDAAEFVRETARLAGDAGFRRGLARRGAAYAREHFDPRRAYIELLDLMALTPERAAR